MPTSSISGSGRHTNKRGGESVDYPAAGRLEVRITPVDVGKRVSVRRVAEIAATAPGVRRHGRCSHIMVRRCADHHTTRRRDRPYLGIRPGRGQTGPARHRSAAAPPRRRRTPPSCGRRRSPAGPPGRPSRSATGCCAPPPDSPAGPTPSRRSAIPGIPLDEALRRVTDWYDTRGLPPLRAGRSPVPRSPPALERTRLACRGPRARCGPPRWPRSPTAAARNG